MEANDPCKMSDLKLNAQVQSINRVEPTGFQIGSRGHSFLHIVRCF